MDGSSLTGLARCATALLGLVRVWGRLPGTRLVAMGTLEAPLTMEEGREQNRNRRYGNAVTMVILPQKYISYSIIIIIWLHYG